MAAMSENVQIVLAAFATAIIVTAFVTAVFFASQYIEQRWGGKQKSRMPVLSDSGIRELVQEGSIQEAVDLYMRFTGVDQYSARDAVEQIEQEIRLESEPSEPEQVQRREDEMERGDEKLIPRRLGEWSIEVILNLLAKGYYETES